MCFYMIAFVTFYINGIKIADRTFIICFCSCLQSLVCCSWEAWQSGFIHSIRGRRPRLFTPALFMPGRREWTGTHVWSVTIKGLPLVTPLFQLGSTSPTFCSQIPFRGQVMSESDGPTGQMGDLGEAVFVLCCTEHSSCKEIQSSPFVGHLCHRCVLWKSTNC